MALAGGAMQQTDAFPELDRDLRFFPLGVGAPRFLTEAQVDHYNTRGYLSPIDLFDAREIGEIRAYFDDLLGKALAAGWTSHELTNWHKHCRGVYDLVSHPRILDVVQDLLGDTLILRNSHFFVKLPGDESRVSWHQDASYWPLTPSKVVSVWLAIDDSDRSNGAMQVVPRSHLGAQIPFEESAAEERNFLSQTVKNPERYGDTPVALTLRAGQMSLHSDWILHGTEPNPSDRRRCGLAMRYLSSDVRAFNGWNRDSIICRGRDPSGHWADNPRPEADAIPEKPASTEPANRAFTHGWVRDGDARAGDQDTSR